MSGARPWRGATPEPAGDGGLMVAFPARDGAALAAVRALDAALAAAPPPGLTETVPGYASLLLAFDPLGTDHAALAAALKALPPAPAAAVPPRAGHRVTFRTDAGRAPDLPGLADRLGLSPADLLTRLAAAPLEVAMHGFAPGYAYLAGLPAALRHPRKPEPVRGVPAGSVLLAGAQALVTTLTMPTGWWVIGRADAVPLTPDGGPLSPFAPGDRVRLVGRPA
jgi:inhibitor of KinA